MKINKWKILKQMMKNLDKTGLPDNEKYDMLKFLITVKLKGER